MWELLQLQDGCLFNPHWWLLNVYKIYCRYIQHILHFPWFQHLDKLYKRKKKKYFKWAPYPPLYIQRTSLRDETDIFFNDCNTRYRKCIDMFTCLFGSLILFITVWKQRAIFRPPLYEILKNRSFPYRLHVHLGQTCLHEFINMYWLKWCNQDVYFHRIENGKNGKLSINL